LEQQAAVMPVGADKGGIGGSSGPKMGTAPTVREACGGARRGSGPQNVAFTASTFVAPPASDGGGSNQTSGCGDGVQGSDGGTEVPIMGVGVDSSGGFTTVNLMPAITSRL
jgi:hypothetical protein